MTSHAPVVRRWNWPEYVGPVLFLIFTLGFITLSYKYPPASRQIPLGVGWASLFLIILDFLTRPNTEFGRALKRMLAPKAEAVKVGTICGGPSLHREAAAIGWLVAYTVCSLAFGLLPATAAYIYLYMTLWGGRTRLHAALTTLGGLAFIYLMFEVLLRYELYRGAVFN